MTVFAFADRFARGEPSLVEQLAMRSSDKEHVSEPSESIGRPNCGTRRIASGRCTPAALPVHATLRASSRSPRVAQAVLDARAAR